MNDHETLFHTFLVLMGLFFISLPFLVRSKRRHDEEYFVQLKRRKQEQEDERELRISRRFESLHQHLEDTKKGFQFRYYLEDHPEHPLHIKHSTMRFIPATGDTFQISASNQRGLCSYCGTRAPKSVPEKEPPSSCKQCGAPFD